MSTIWRKINLNPVISEIYYNLPIIKYLFKSIWSVSMWDMQRWTSSSDDIHKFFESIKTALNSWKNILLYSAWQLYHQWYEVIKWKKA